MALCCKHTKMNGVCGTCKQKKAYTVFKYNPECNKVGDEDKCCGYFYGPDHPLENQKVPIRKKVEPAKTNSTEKFNAQIMARMNYILHMIFD